MRSCLTRAGLLLAALALAACSLPRGAAVQSEVLRERDAETPTFQVVEVTRGTLPAIAAWPGGYYSYGVHHWPDRVDSGNGTIIRAGDRLTVTVWDSQENSLLTNPGERYTVIAGIEVDDGGFIFLPYIEKVAVAGLTPSSARTRIQSRLEPIVPSAQVQVGLEQGRNYAVDVVGGVGNPGAYPMPSRDYKMLSLLADAGGIPTGLRNPQVKLMRGHKTFAISAKRLYHDTKFNVVLRPRDTVIVEEDHRSFVAFGASGVEDLIYFPKDRLTAIEAISLMGGLSDNRADPKGVLILRNYHAQYLRPDGKGPERQQVVFVFDLTSADGLFAAGKFQIKPDDTVLATESPVTNARTVFGLIGSVFGLSAQAGVLAN